MRNLTARNGITNRALLVLLGALTTPSAAQNANTNELDINWQNPSRLNLLSLKYAAELSHTAGGAIPAIEYYVRNKDRILHENARREMGIQENYPHIGELRRIFLKGRDDFSGFISGSPDYSHYSLLPLGNIGSFLQYLREHDTKDTLDFLHEKASSEALKSGYDFPLYYGEIVAREANDPVSGAIFQELIGSKAFRTNPGMSQEQALSDPLVKLEVDNRLQSTKLGELTNKLNGFYEKFQQLESQAEQLRKDIDGLGSLNSKAFDKAHQQYHSVLKEMEELKKDAKKEIQAQLPIVSKIDRAKLQFQRNYQAYQAWSTTATTLVNLFDREAGQMLGLAANALLGTGMAWASSGNPIFIANAITANLQLIDFVINHKKGSGQAQAMQAIMNALQEISKQLNEIEKKVVDLRNEMHERFNAIQEVLQDGFESIGIQQALIQSQLQQIAVEQGRTLLELRNFRAETVVDLADIKHSLEEISAYQVQSKRQVLRDLRRRAKLSPPSSQDEFEAMLTSAVQTTLGGINPPEVTGSGLNADLSEHYFHNLLAGRGINAVVGYIEKLALEPHKLNGDTEAHRAAFGEFDQDLFARIDYGSNLWASNPEELAYALETINLILKSGSNFKLSENLSQEIKAVLELNKVNLAFYKWIADPLLAEKALQRYERARSKVLAASIEQLGDPNINRILAVPDGFNLASGIEQFMKADPIINRATQWGGTSALQGPEHEVHLKVTPDKQNPKRDRRDYWLDRRSVLDIFGRSRIANAFGRGIPDQRHPRYNLLQELGTRVADMKVSSCGTFRNRETYTRDHSYDKDHHDEEIGRSTTRGREFDRTSVHYAKFYHFTRSSGYQTQAYPRYKWNINMGKNLVAEIYCTARTHYLYEEHLTSHKKMAIQENQERVREHGTFKAPPIHNYYPDFSEGAAKSWRLIKEDAEDALFMLQDFLAQDPVYSTKDIASFSIDVSEGRIFEVKVGWFVEGKEELESTTLPREELVDAMNAHFNKRYGKQQKLEFTNLYGSWKGQRDFKLAFADHISLLEQSQVKASQALLGASETKGSRLDMALRELDSSAALLQSLLWLQSLAHKPSGQPLEFIDLLPPISVARRSFELQLDTAQISNATVSEALTTWKSQSDTQAEAVRNWLAAFAKERELNGQDLSYLPRNLSARFRELSHLLDR